MDWYIRRLPEDSNTIVCSLCKEHLSVKDYFFSIDLSLSQYTSANQDNSLYTDSIAIVCESCYRSEGLNVKAQLVKLFGISLNKSKNGLLTDNIFDPIPVVNIYGEINYINFKLED